MKGCKLLILAARYVFMYFNVQAMQDTNQQFNLSQWIFSSRFL